MESERLYTSEQDDRAIEGFSNYSLKANTHGRGGLLHTFHFSKTPVISTNLCLPTSQLLCKTVFTYCR